LLDPERGGRFAIRPDSTLEATRRYVDHTNVLETTFRTPSGVVRLTDLMPVAPEAEKRRGLWPAGEILRRIECTEGVAHVAVRYCPRPDYARKLARLRQHPTLGLRLTHGARLATLRTDFPLTLDAQAHEAHAHVSLRAGERRYMSLTLSDSEPAVIPALGREAERRIESSLGWWRAWSARCAYDGRYRAAVVRSALALKLLTFAPSGAVVAAPTTSLPETPGGERNWDYRYCWLRDASLTLQVLFDLGYREEAESYVSWLLHTTRITWPKLRVLYDVYGSPDLPERHLAHLEGFAGSRPVRIGNEAAGQLQLDIYGEVLDAVYEFVLRGGRLDHTTARMLVGLGRTVCACWQAPDEGIWEVRSGRRHHTFSKAMCWVALDRLIRLHDARQLRAPCERFARTRDEIRERIEAGGFSEALGSYVAVLDGEELDASLLLLGRYGYADPRSPRMLGTLDALRGRLGRNALMFRYLEAQDGLPPGEGTFGACAFWAVRGLATAGRLQEAMRAFEELLDHANDVGLFAEEIDVVDGSLLGNFPQAFTHVALVDAALTLDRIGRGEPG
jgi:GH15 family glucan-1,4-alpha-glucosidase